MIKNMENEKVSPYLNIFRQGISIVNEIPNEEYAYSFKYNLDPFQKEGIYRIYKNENILISAPTGTGKSTFAEYAIAHCLKNNKKVIYTSPIKSLSNQKYAEFRQKFNDNIGIVTGDIKMNVDASCLIMTTEILRNLLYKTSSMTSYISSLDINEIGTVIFDECHYINDPSRGKIWEESIILLPKTINLVLLSASISNPEQFCNWIANIKEHPITLISTTHRIVPLNHYFYKSYLVDNNGKEETKFELLEILDHNNKFKNYDAIKKNYKIYDVNKLMDKLVDFLSDNKLLPALFFILSRKKCETICKTVRKSLLTFEEISEVENIFHHYMKDYKKIYEKLPQYNEIYAQLKKGCVFHHSGIIPVLKEIIEIIYTKGLIKILFATETFAIGINAPTKTVLFSQLEKFDNDGPRDLRSDEYLQMAGRSGRRGIDTKGVVIILPTMGLPSELSLKTILTGKPPMLQSKFTLTYQFVLKMFCSDEFDTNTFLGNTLIMDENDKKALFMSIEKETIEKKMEEIMIDQNMINNLENYDKIQKKLNDTFFMLKKKDREKYEKEKKNIELLPNFKDEYKKFQLLCNYKNELVNINYNIFCCNNLLNQNIEIIRSLLEKEEYMNSDKSITKKGIIARGINECQELIFTEMICKGLLDDLDFPEIISVLSSFINEKESNDEKYISDLKVSKNIIYVLKELTKIADYFIRLEEDYKLYIDSDYKLNLDFIEPSYIWANGGTIQEVYQYTTVYDGNFVKAIMRINNICENLMDICKNIERFDICTKLENYEQKLIRDVTTINSLYVKL